MRVGDLDVLELADVDAWDAWLTEHHADTAEAWLRVRRKSAGIALVEFGDALECALCHGWIDSMGRSLDEVSRLQRFSPRRPRSPWSQVNVAKVEALIAAGRMRPGGMAEVEAARADGRWAAAYPSQSQATVPEDLAEALAAVPGAAEAFGRLSRSEQYALMLPVYKALTEAGRARVVARVVAKLSD